MASRYDPSDGLSQLTELMRTEEAPPPRGPRAIDPATRRRRLRRGLIATAIVVVVLGALVASYIGFALGAPVGHATATLERPAVATPAAAKIVLAPDGEEAVSVSGAPDYLGANGVSASTSDDPQPMASISKIITALVILQAKPLTSATDPGPAITFSKADHDLYDQYYVQGATIAPMPTGSSLSEHDALETTLVVSASNYAVALSRWAYGSDEAFLRAARAWLAANGMTHTTIQEPTGLDDRNRSTPSDLLTLGRLAMANPAIAAIVGTRSLDLPGTAVDGMQNTNDLLGADGIDGVKTGTLDNGSDLLFSSTLSVPEVSTPLRVVGVVLGGDSRSSVDDDVEETLHSIAAGFHETDLGHRGDVVGTYTTRWGARADMVLDGSPSVVTWSDTPITARMTTTTLTTGAAGRKVGTVTWTAGTTTVSVPVVLDHAIAAPSAWWRLTHPFELGT